MPQAVILFQAKYAVIALFTSNIKIDVFMNMNNKKNVISH